MVLQVTLNRGHTPLVPVCTCLSKVFVRICDYSNKTGQGIKTSTFGVCPHVVVIAVSESSRGG
jgi:hypothetical protein